jgi:hypothetical protein
VDIGRKLAAELVDSGSDKLEVRAVLQPGVLADLLVVFLAAKFI